MGSWRLIFLLLAATSCASRFGLAPPVARPKGPRHTQVFHAAHTRARLAVVDGLRERDGEWIAKVDDVDAIRLIVRHATRVDPPGPTVEMSDDVAERAAMAFATKMADLLGIAPDDVAHLDIASFPLVEGRHVRVVRLSGTLRMRGYEAFESVQSTVEIACFVDDDGVVRELKNASRLHPRLTLETRPRLDPDDPALLGSVVGRPVFVVLDDPRRPNARVRELRREQLGLVTETDVVARTLTIHVSPGPFDAYVAYDLAYAIKVGRGGYWFRFVVDADTGELLDDAVVPVVSGR